MCGPLRTQALGWSLVLVTGIIRHRGTGAVGVWGRGGVGVSFIFQAYTISRPRALNFLPAGHDLVPCFCPPAGRRDCSARSDAIKARMDTGTGSKHPSAQPTLKCATRPPAA